MRKFLPTFKALTLAVIFLSHSIYASEETRITPNSRPLSEIEKVAIQKERALEEEKSGKELNQNLSAFDDLPAANIHKGIYFTSHPGAFHNPLLISALGDSVEIEDGSIWSISPSDTYKTLNWITSDLVVITPNHDWFSSHMFRMTNQNTGVSVKCNLVLGPIYNGLYTHWIVAINYYTQQICLEDGSIWTVTGFDSSVFSKWLINDTVIIGINDGFLSSSKPNILINVNTLTYARCNCSY